MVHIVRKTVLFSQFFETGRSFLSSDYALLNFSISSDFEDAFSIKLILQSFPHTPYPPLLRFYNVVIGEDALKM